MERFKNFIARRWQLIPGWLFAAMIIGSATVTCMGIVYNYINSKVLVIQIGCLTALCLGMGVLSFRNVWTIIYSSRIVQAALIFATLSLVATIVGLDPALSFYGHFERGTGLFLLLLIIGGVFSGVVYAYQKQVMRTLVLYPVSLAGGLLAFFTWIGVTGLNLSTWNILGISSGGGATMGNSSFAGTVLIITFFVTVFLFLTTQNTLYRKFEQVILFFIAFITLVNPVLVTTPFFKPLAGTAFGFIGDARGATLALLVGIGVAIGAWLLFSYRTTIRLGAIVWLTSITVTVIMGIAALVIPGTAIRESFVRSSGEARFMYWQMALEQTKGYWLLGTGPETFRYAHEKYFDPKLLLIGEPWADKPHSVYVETLLTTGVLGLAAYSALFFFMMRVLVRAGKHPKNRAFVASISGLLAAYAINNIIIFDTMTSQFLFFVVVFWVASETEWQHSAYKISEKNRVEPLERIEVKWLKQAGKGLLVFAIGVPVGFMIYNEYQKLAMVWKELFAQPPERTALYQMSERMSVYGAGISFAQRADDYGQQYQRSSQLPKEMILKDIKALNETLIATMQKYPANMQSYMALGNLALAYLNQGGAEKNSIVEKVWVSQLEIAAQGIRRLSPNHPKAQYFFEQLHSVQSQ